MRCHYDILEISRDATPDEIKKAYRKKALQWHPDKNADRLEEAKKRFLEVQDAYETLIDDQERAWYDSHREVLINGGTPGNAKDQVYLYNIYPYFTNSCFRGFDDSEKGFYTVYRDVFNKIAEEDKSHYEEELEVPDFGDSKSSYEDVVNKFYAFWQSYCTPRSFVWVEEHDTREAQDRYVRRAMEKQNKKLRDKAKKERNEDVRRLVAFVRKKDKRLDDYKKQLEERALQAQKKIEEKREADRLRRLEQIKNYVEPEWMRATDEKFEGLTLEDDVHASDEEKSSEEEDFFCIACNKSFKSEKAYKNHENSKKHKENIELLRKHMKDEDMQLFGDKNADEIDNENENEEKGLNHDTEKSKTKLSKKQKKKNKQRRKAQMDEESDSEELDQEEIEISTANENPIIDEIKIETESSNENNNNNASKLNKNIETTKAGETEEIEPSKPIICSVCNQEFESRNKLFEHIKEEGHAAPKTINKKVPDANTKANKKNKKSKK